MPRRPESVLGTRGQQGSRPLAHAGVLGAVAMLATALVLVQPVRGAGQAALNAAAAAWRGIFADRPKTTFSQRMIVLLTAPSLADRVASATSPPTAADERRWVAEAEAAQRILLTGLHDHGVDVRPEVSFVRTLNGFSAVLDPRAVAALERAPGVTGLFPVRTVYPASISAETLARPEFALGQGRRPESGVAGVDGSGITIALLDTGVDRSHPYLHGQVLRGIDLLGGDRGAAAAGRPDQPGTLENHGTRMAGILVGTGGPAGLRGIAPGASVLPIRVLGWQQAADGSYALLGRGDELIAGLERAVDPNRDGDVSDAARIALAAVTEPYSAFADSPEARAVRGATELGTLVVAAAGNDGPGGDGFGTVGTPGGAPDALTVGALDARRSVLGVPIALRLGGGAPARSETGRLLGAVPPSSTQTLGVTALFGPTLAHADRPSDERAAGTVLADFFDTHGVSLVAGKAVLLGDGSALASKTRNAAQAGAAAVLVPASSLPAGVLDLDEAAAIPVVAISGAAGRDAAGALAGGTKATVTLGPTAPSANPLDGHVAAFSSGGIAFGGGVEPELVAPGVGIATADAGRASDGSGLYATVTGTSAAAAIVAGDAALLAQARPSLGAAELRGALAGSAVPVANGTAVPSVTVQGAGRVDTAAAAAASLAVEPAVLAFSRVSGDRWQGVRTITVHNLGAKPLDVHFALTVDGGGATSIGFAAQPARLRLVPGGQRDVAIVTSAKAGIPPRGSGVLLVAADGAPSARVPWAVTVQPTAERLIGSLQLSNRAFAPSSTAPAVLAFQAGSATSGPSGESVDPVGTLDLELWTPDGKRLGVLARLRDLLPGRYAFGLTGRGPNGKTLAPGRYVLRLRARPVDARDGAAASTAQTAFRIVP